jgi:hypothetical protein
MSEDATAARIGMLTDQQAIRALHLFYELLPPASWENARKPSPERLKTLAAGIAEEAPVDLQAAVSALLDDSNPAGASARAALARLVLTQAVDSPQFAPAAMQAMTTAAKPEMFIEPVTAALMFALVLSVSDIKAGGFRYQSRLPNVIKELRLPELVGKLGPVLRALPIGIAEAIARRI